MNGRAASLGLGPIAATRLLDEWLPIMSRLTNCTTLPFGRPAGGCAASSHAPPLPAPVNPRQASRAAIHLRTVLSASVPGTRPASSLPARNPTRALSVARSYGLPSLMQLAGLLAASGAASTAAQLVIIV